MTALLTFRQNKLRAVPRAPPTLAHSGNPVGCHTARFSSRLVAVAPAARRAVCQPTELPSVRPACAVAAPAHARAPAHGCDFSGVRIVAVVVPLQSCMG